MNLVPLVIADVELQLSTSIAVGGTSFTLASATDDDGNALPAGMYCFTVDSGTSNKEYLMGQLNGTAVTGVSRISRQGAATSGAGKAHRVGAPVILTNFAALQRVADILRGQITLDSANPIKYDGEPTLSDNAELATVGYVIAAASGSADLTFSAQIISGVNAGETVAAGDLLYLKTDDQEWYKTDADTAATVNGVQLGIALGAGSDGAGISGGVQISGVYTTTGLTAGSTYYASNTAGEYAATAGTTERAVGLALSTTKLLLIPTSPLALGADTVDALAGTSGTPSTSNKFVTDDDTTGTGDILRASKHTKLISAINVNDTFGGAASNPEENIVSVEIPAGALGTSNLVRVKMYVTLFTAGLGSNNADLSLRLKYGATTVATLTLGHAANSGISNQNGYIEAILFANASTSSQLGDLQMQVHPDSLGDQTITGGMATATGSASEDSTSAKNLVVSVDLADNVYTTLVISHAIVELITS